MPSVKNMFAGKMLRELSQVRRVRRKKKHRSHQHRSQARCALIREGGRFRVSLFNDLIQEGCFASHYASLCLQAELPKTQFWSFLSVALRSAQTKISVTCLVDHKVDGPLLWRYRKGPNLHWSHLLSSNPRYHLLSEYCTSWATWIASFCGCFKKLVKPETFGPLQICRWIWHWRVVSSS